MKTPYQAHMDGMSAALSLAFECGQEAANHTGEKESYWRKEQERHLERASFYEEMAKRLNKNVCLAPGCFKKRYRRELCQPHWYDDLNGRDFGPPRSGKRGVVAIEILRAADHGEFCIFWPTSQEKFYPHGIHRIMCEDQNGPPPEGKRFACHECGNGNLGCVNKTHLKWGSAKDNVEDTKLTGSYQRGENTSSAKIKESDVIKIISLLPDHSDLEIASMFSIRRSHVNQIRNVKCWKHIKRERIPIKHKWRKK